MSAWLIVSQDRMSVHHGSTGLKNQPIERALIVDVHPSTEVVAKQTPLQALST
jgi:hypothetical protein